MRWFVACLVLASSATASARVKILIEPVVVRRCSHAASWDRVEKCLAALGQATVVRTLPHARVVEMTKRHDGEVDLGGVYLYVERDKEWHLGGMYGNNGGNIEVLAAEAITHNHHHGFRLEIGEVQRTFVSLDDIGAVPAVLSQVQVLYCSGDNWRCTSVVRACDVIVRGAAKWSFRGKIVVDDNELRVVGDRSNTGASCMVPERNLLGWSPNE
jgi:hypothetical protein